MRGRKISMQQRRHFENPNSTFYRVPDAMVDVMHAVACYDTETPAKKREAVEHKKRLTETRMRELLADRKTLVGRFGFYSINLNLLEQYSATKDIKIAIADCNHDFRRLNLSSEQKAKVMNDEIWQQLVIKFYDLAVEWMTKSETDKRIAAKRRNNPNSFSAMLRSMSNRIQAIIETEST